MKKLYLVITLFVSSFFLFNSYVKADIVIPDGDIENFITEDFLTVRSYVIDYAKLNNFNYFIEYSSSYKYSIYFYPNNTNLILYSNYIKFPPFYYYKINSDFSFTLIAEYSGSNFPITNTSRYFDMSEEIYTTSSFNIIYNNLTYTVDENNKFFSYYDIYCDINNIVEEENPHQEEIEKIGNFYTVVIDKLGYLVEEISSNYIYLSIIVIFLLVLVFKLVFRRFL